MNKRTILCAGISLGVLLGVFVVGPLVHTMGSAQAVQREQAKKCVGVTALQLESQNQDAIAVFRIYEDGSVERKAYSKWDFPAKWKE